LAVTAIVSGAEQKWKFDFVLADHPISIGIRPAKEVATERFGAGKA